MNSKKKLISIPIIIFIIGQLFNYLFHKGYTQYYIHKTHKLNAIVNDKYNYSILFLGSSRTHLHINPSIIDSVCNTNSFNFGQDGGKIYEQYMLLNAYLESHLPPKIIELNIDLNSFDNSKPIVDPNQYFFYTQNKYIYYSLSQNGFYPFLFRNNLFLSLIEFDEVSKCTFLLGLIGKNEIPLGEKEIKGYLTNTLNKIDSNQANTFNNLPLNYTIGAEKYLDSIVQICNLKKIKLIITYAPEYKNLVSNNTKNSYLFFKLLNLYCKNNNLPFYRYDLLSLNNWSGYFANVGHLNTIGANYYSKQVAKDLCIFCK